MKLYRNECNEMKPGQRERAAQLEVYKMTVFIKSLHIISGATISKIARHWIVEDMIYLQAQTKSGEGVLESERQVTDKQ